MTPRESLEAAHERFIKFSEDGNQPPNEAAVGTWIVLPTLRALGYADEEILPEMTGGTSGRPDFTVLKGDAAMWFIELKSWQTPLSDQHATQAINYAHEHGKRWVVVTNGQEWRLYDDNRPGTSADRLVATVKLTSRDDWVATLLALERRSVIGGDVARHLARRGLADTIPALLFDSDGPIVKQIAKVLAQRLGDVLPTDVAQYFRDVFDTTPQSAASGVAQDSSVALAYSPSDSTANPTVIAHEVTIKGVGVKAARGLWDGSKLTVLPGTCCRLQPVPSDAESFTKRWATLPQGTYQIEDGYRVVIREIAFKSPSGAASFVLGRSSNGWIDWKLPDGRNLAVLETNKLDT